MMNMQTLLSFRSLLMVLLIGAQWCGTSLVSYQAALSKQLILVSNDFPLIQETSNQGLPEASIGLGVDSITLAALLRFNGRTVVGMEDSLTLFQEVEASANSPLAIPLESPGRLKDTVFAELTALAEQSLILQHTRLQI